MSLARMLNIDSDAIECDLAETYHIYDMRELPPKRVALFCVGLRDDSRIKMKLAHVKAPLDTLILSNIADKLSIEIWQKRGAKKDDKPDLIMPNMIEKEYFNLEDNKDIVCFTDGKEFEKVRKMIIAGEVT